MLGIMPYILCLELCLIYTYIRNLFVKMCVFSDDYPIYIYIYIYMLYVYILYILFILYIYILCIHIHYYIIIIIMYNVLHIIYVICICIYYSKIVNKHQGDFNHVCQSKQELLNLVS